MNMALDEALLESAASGGRGSCRAEPTLRIYQWAEPTLSLGYFQAATERESHPASRDCHLIRRPSGGGAILHDRELTYALALPAEIATTRPSAQWYLEVHFALVHVICELTGTEAVLCETASKLNMSEESFLCFQRRASGDVLLGQHKIAGSAQRRRKDAILQHGSILIACSPCAPELPGINNLAGRTLDLSSLAEHFAAQIARRLNWQAKQGPFENVELENASSLAIEKYGSSSWTLRR